MSEFNDVQKEFLENLFEKLSHKIELTSNQIKEEIKEKLENVEKDIKGRISNIEERINNLEVENRNISQHHLNIERKIRKNNIAVFGIKEDEKNLLKVVCDIFQNELELQIDATDLNDIYRVNGKAGNKLPVIVEFISYQKKIVVLREAKKLKGSNIFIVKDQCAKDREGNKILVKHRKAAREKRLGAYIKGSKLFIQDIPYTVKQLKNNPHVLEDHIQREEDPSLTVGPSKEIVNSSTMPYGGFPKANKERKEESACTETRLLRNKNMKK